MASALIGCDDLKGLKQKRETNHKCVWWHCSPRHFQGLTASEERLSLLDLWASKGGQIRAVIIGDQHKTVLPACTAGVWTRILFKF